MEAMMELASIFNTPLHPILVNFTAALIPLSFLSDLLARVLKRPSLAAAGWWMLLYAAIITPVTAFAGWWWYRDMAMPDHWQMNYHFWLGWTLVGLLAVWIFWRGWYNHRGQTPGWGYLLATLVIVTAVVVQGNLGGEMTFGQGESSPEEHPHHMPMQHPDHTHPSEATTQK